MKIIRNGLEYELTPAEIRLAYEEESHEYDRVDLRNFFDCCAEDDDLQWFTAMSVPVQDAIIEHLAEQYHEVAARQDTWACAREAIWELDYSDPGWRENVAASVEAIDRRAHDEACYDARLR